jgi:hypothetical protein
MTKRLDLAAVDVRGGPLVLITDIEVDDLEASLGVRMPDGYREYITVLGEGDLNSFVRVLPPWRILAELDDHRGMMASGWHWDTGKASFGQDEAMESIPIVDMADGQAVVIFQRSDPGQLIVLPREDDRVYFRGPDLMETVEWMCSGRVIRSFGPKRYFEPFDSRPDLTDRYIATSPAKSVEPAPDLTGHPLDVLMAYFAELRGVEEGAVAGSGGPEALRLDHPPEPDEDWYDELIARSDAIHTRYCSPTLAAALSGSSVTIGWPLEHDPARVRVLDVCESRPDRVTIRTAEGEFGFQHEYVLERSGGEWRIKAQRHL